MESILPNCHLSGFPIFAVKLESLEHKKKCRYCTTAKLSREKRNNSLFTKKKSLVGLTPDLKTIFCVFVFEFLFVRIRNISPYLTTSLFLI